MKRYNIVYILGILLSFIVSQNYTLSGFIKDSESGESIPGANVYLSNTNYGSSTDIDGYFIILDIPNKNYTLNISYLGYEKITILIYSTNGFL